MVNPLFSPSLIGYNEIHCIYGEVTELAEGARLESVCTLTGYRGFESPPLRHSKLYIEIHTVISNEWCISFLC